MAKEAAYAFQPDRPLDKGRCILMYCSEQIAQLIDRSDSLGGVSVSQLPRRTSINPNTAIVNEDSLTVRLGLAGKF